MREGPGRARSRAVAVAALCFAVAASLSPAPVRAQAPGWPRAFDFSGGRIVIYQPQPEDLSHDQLSGRAAFSIQKTPDGNPLFGVIWFTENISIDRDSSTVEARGFDVTKVRLPDITPDEASRYEHAIESEATHWDLSGSLEELRTGLAAAERERANVNGLNHSPPRILVSKQRAMLLLFDGAPIFESVSGTRLEHATNTPYAVIHDPRAGIYYLSGANLWYSAQNPLGPWTPADRVPDEVRAVVPPDTSTADWVSGGPPLVITATAPTELISFDGEPQYQPLVGDELLYVVNTENDVLREVSTQSVYVLLSGRWYRGPSLNGPWGFVLPNQLPASFRDIPPDSPMGHLLASVAGTDEAEDAVADAEIPQTSAIQRAGVDLDIEYDGPPDFEPIAGTSLRYAANCNADVVLADGRYYACVQGVWYVGDSPGGPWSVSEVRPVGVDDVPPSCPIYHDRYVYIYDWTPDVVYVGYLPGYLGCYPYYGTVVYGTGYYYHPWHRLHYYPWPYTWGFHARYNPWLARWSFGFSYGSGFLRVGMRWTGPHPPLHPIGPPRWLGPGGFHRPLLAVEGGMQRMRRPLSPRPGGGDVAPWNLYNRPSNIGRVARNVPRMPVVPTPRPPQGAPNNVFAGRDGNVYRRQQGGAWQVNQGAAWKPARMPATPLGHPAEPQPPGGAAGGAAGGGSTVRPAQHPIPQPASSPPAEPGGSPVAHEPFRPATAPQPPAPQGGSMRPAPRPPQIEPTPGNLEREFHARERGSTPPPPVQPRPKSPPRQESEKPKKSKDR